MLLNRPDLRVAAIESVRTLLVHVRRIIAFYEIRTIASARVELYEFLIARASLRRWAGNFVTIQMQDREDGAIPQGIQKLIALPAPLQRPCFRFAIADHAGHDERRIIKRGAVSVQQ